MYKFLIASMLLMSSYKTPNYNVQRLFGLNKGTALGSLLKDGQPIAGQAGCRAGAVLGSTTNELIIKLINISKNRKDIRIDLAEGSRSTRDERLTPLTAVTSG